MNGIDTTIFIREKLIFPKNIIPIIALTAFDVDVVFKNKTINEIGFNMLFTKPYKIETIKNNIKKILDN
jgi:hypothetical protein